MRLPSYNLLYFKNLLDLAFLRFFEEYNDSFLKNEKEEYVLVKNLSIQELEKFFEKEILKTLSRILKPYDLLSSPDFYFIIGACQPKNNFLINFKEGYFPSKLQKVLEDKYSLKYLLKEKDIKIDNLKFNEACQNIFNKFFSDESFQKRNPILKNAIFIQHKNLDCYSMFKILKCIFGKANCKNLKEEFFKDMNPPIIAINDLIDKYINNKIAANKDRRFKKMYEEIKQYLGLKIQEIQGK